MILWRQLESATKLFQHATTNSARRRSCRIQARVKKQATALPLAQVCARCFIRGDAKLCGGLGPQISSKPASTQKCTSPSVSTGPLSSTPATLLLLPVANPCLLEAGEIIDPSEVTGPLNSARCTPDLSHQSSGKLVPDPMRWLHHLGFEVTWAW